MAFFRPGLVIGLFGALGSGKTLLASYIAACVRAELGIGIASNYDFKWATRIENLPQLFSLQKTCIVIDEVHVALLDARLHKEKRNINATHWIDLIRKDKCVLIYTAQSLRRADVRLRDITNYVGFCEFLDLGLRSKWVKSQFMRMAPSGLVAYDLGYASLNALMMFDVYNTEDKRVVLGVEPGSLATEPLQSFYVDQDEDDSPVVSVPGRRVQSRTIYKAR